MAKRDSFDALTVAGGEGIGIPSTSTSVSLGFGSWRSASGDRPVMIEVSTLVETDGTTAGEIKVDVDEDGGTTADYSLAAGYAAPELGSGAVSVENASAIVPPGAAYLIQNFADPNGGNQIQILREFEL